MPEVDGRGIQIEVPSKIRERFIHRRSRGSVFLANFIIIMEVGLENYCDRFDSIRTGLTGEVDRGMILIDVGSFWVRIIANDMLSAR